MLVTILAPTDDPRSTQRTATKNPQITPTPYSGADRHLPSRAGRNTTLQRIALLAAAIRAYDRVHELVVCDTCGASWHTIDGDGTCNWCTTAEANQRRWQAELTLTPPNTDPDNPADDGALTAWAERLHRAVQTGLITNQQAETAIRRLAAA